MHASTAVYDDVYVVSDLHMGGIPGFQIFDAGDLLAKTIDHLVERSGRRQIALVVNGDMVDFLAEPDAAYFDSQGAIAKLDRIASDDAFRPVWQSLQRFVKSKRRTLLINLGNHDLELALPWGRERLLSILTEDKPELRGNVHLIFDGSGVRCRVASAEILCLHGNEVDSWNVCDYEELRRQGRDANLGFVRASWIPNAGTKLVIDVMNQIKRRFPFVDLLKPEADAVIPTLFALDPGVRPKLTSALAVAGRLARDSALRRSGFLAEEIPAPELRCEGPAAPQGTLDGILAAAFSNSELLSDDRYDDAQLLLRVSENRFRQQVDPLMLVAESGSQQLGLREAIGAWLLQKPRHELLREALEGLSKDQSFRRDQSDATFERMDAIVGSQIDFLVAGHTHLERAVVRPNGGVYYNSGTWARLIQLRSDVLASAESFARYYRAMQKGTLDALDEVPGMILRRPCVVSISEIDGSAVGTLCQARPSQDGVVLEEVAETKFIKS